MKLNCTLSLAACFLILTPLGSQVLIEYISVLAILPTSLGSFFCKISNKQSKQAEWLMASGAFHHFIKRPHWSPNRNSSLSITNPQPFLGVGDEMDKVNGDLGVNQNNTILSYLNYFLQVMSQKRIWVSKKILDPLHTLSFEGNPDFEPPTILRPCCSSRQRIF